MDLVLLPGMDGTGRLFEPLRNELSSEIRVEVVSYDVERPLDYEALVREVRVRSSAYALVAESFSGPIALSLAGQKPPGLKAVVLVATFVSSPVVLGGCLAPLVGAWMFRRSPPWLVRRYLVGDDAFAAEVDAVRSAIGSVAPSVVALRIREVLRVNRREALRSCPVPVTYLRGTRDRIVPASMMSAMQAILPSMACIEIEAPHLVLQRRPAESAAVILRSLIG